MKKLKAARQAKAAGMVGAPCALCREAARSGGVVLTPAEQPVAICHACINSSKFAELIADALLDGDEKWRRGTWFSLQALIASRARLEEV